VSVDAAGPLDHTFAGCLLGEAGGVSWVCVLVPGSVALLGTGRAVKVSGTIDSQPFTTALMPTGAGGHMLPVKAALRRSLCKDVGDDVTVHIDQRVS